MTYEQELIADTVYLETQVSELENRVKQLEQIILELLREKYDNE